MQQLRGCNAIVAGASRGLGVHIARALAREGVNLALAARSSSALEKVSEEVKSFKVQAVTLSTDLSKAAQVEMLAEETERQLGPVDIKPDG